MLNKKEIEFALSIVQKGLRKKKKSVLSDTFKSKWYVGTLISRKNEYIYSFDDITLIESLLVRSGIDSQNKIEFGGSRGKTGEQIVNEKEGASPVFPKPICMKVINEGVQINGLPIYKTGVGHLQFNYQDIETIQANCIVMVENLETFRLLDTVICDIDTTGYLFIWRGGPNSKLSIPNTQKFIRVLGEYCNIEIGCFADYDLKGLIIAQELGGHFAILPNIHQLKEQKIQGSEKDYAKQWDEYDAKKYSIAAVESLKPYADYLLDKKQSFTQERMCALSVTHQLIRLIQHDK
tara:strand:+ start:2765 stop:3643 length:879 start_codon:yes stop_codon:yes gene_type:complete